MIGRSCDRPFGLKEDATRGLCRGPSGLRCYQRDLQGLYLPSRLIARLHADECGATVGRQAHLRALWPLLQSSLEPSACRSRHVSHSSAGGGNIGLATAASNLLANHLVLQEPSLLLLSWDSPTPLRRPVLANHFHPSTPGKPALSCRSYEPMSLATHLGFPSGAGYHRHISFRPCCFAQLRRFTPDGIRGRVSFRCRPWGSLRCKRSQPKQSLPKKSPIWPVRLFPQVLLPFKGLLLLQRQSVSPRPSALLLLSRSRSIQVAESEDPTLQIHPQAKTKLQGFVR